MIGSGPLQVLLLGLLALLVRPGLVHVEALRVIAVQVKEPCLQQEFPGVDRKDGAQPDTMPDTATTNRLSTRKRTELEAGWAMGSGSGRRRPR